VPASDTGAFEMAMWSMLGARPVDVFTWESFGSGWATDIAKQLKLKDARLISDYGELPDLTQANPEHDIVFTWNGTTSGVKVPERRLDQRHPRRPDPVRRDQCRVRDGHALEKLDVVTFSWQKAWAAKRRTACSCCRRAP
jgi:phosphoserine aminotransferase